MDQKTKSVTAPSGAVIEMKQQLTAGEFLDISEENEKQNLTKTQLTKRLVDACVVAVNGVTENVPTLLRELSLSDYTFLANELKKVVDGDFTEAKNQ